MWTGDEMIIWGGYFFDATQHYLKTGGRYNPTSDNWKAITQSNAPYARSHNTAVLTPTDSSESAIIANLRPGNYTAIVHDTTGVGPAEVYAASNSSAAATARTKQVIFLFSSH